MDRQGQALEGLIEPENSKQSIRPASDLHFYQLFIMF
jgi:hypothetical protein